MTKAGDCSLKLGFAGLLALMVAAAPGCGPRPPAHAGESALDTSAMASGARAFLSTLDDTRRSEAVRSFDDQQRTRWTYLPQDRIGIPLKAMNEGQRAAAFTLLGTGLSERGVALARGVIELEGILRELEGRLGGLVGPTRDPELYYTTVFLEPGGADPWSWRFEGHHLSVNVTDLGAHGQVVAPLFMGANPARTSRGQRLLAAEEDLAFELLHMLEPQQRARATISGQTFGDIVTRDDPVARAVALAGLPASDMTTAQQQQLRRLLELYAGRMADSAAVRQLRRIDDAGFERLHFAWAGSHQPRQPHYYRIHGPTVLVEYDNSQSSANHIHTVWRDLENDFGGDLLRRHYARHAHR